MKTSEEAADQFTAPHHEHRHSVYVRCTDCLMFGTPLPEEFQCGNCQSMNTVSYVSACCVTAFAQECTSKAFEECAKISETLLDDGKPTHRGSNAARYYAGQYIACEIRALKGRL